MDEQLIETWKIHNRLHHLLLGGIAEGGLAATTGKGRTVGEQFAHIHNVRLMWLKASAPDLRTGLTSFERGGELTAETLAAALDDSAPAIAALLRRGFSEDRIKSFKPHPAAFLGYLLSHESHHRGQITLTLKLAGFPLDRKVLFGLWEWGTH